MARAQPSTAPAHPAPPRLAGRLRRHRTTLLPRKRIGLPHLRDPGHAALELTSTAGTARTSPRRIPRPPEPPARRRRSRCPPNCRIHARGPRSAKPTPNDWASPRSAGKWTPWRPSRVNPDLAPRSKGSCRRLRRPRDPSASGPVLVTHKKDKAYAEQLDAKYKDLSPYADAIAAALGYQSSRRTSVRDPADLRDTTARPGRLRRRTIPFRDTPGRDRHARGCGVHKPGLWIGLIA